MSDEVGEWWASVRRAAAASRRMAEQIAPNVTRCPEDEDNDRAWAAIREARR